MRTPARKYGKVMDAIDGRTAGVDQVGPSHREDPNTIQRNAGAQ